MVAFFMVVDLGIKKIIQNVFYLLDFSSRNASVSSEASKIITSEVESAHFSPEPSSPSLANKMPHFVQMITHVTEQVSWSLFSNLL